MLGSSFGSTNAASIDPRTGKRYGSRFPAITVTDIVTAQRRLLEHLGVKHLRAVVGPSYGGFQAFQWGVSFPDFMDGIVPVVSAPKARLNMTADTRARFERDPNWNGGDYYDTGGMVATMTELRVETLHRYGATDEAAIQRAAAQWASVFDANSLLILGHAAEQYDVTRRTRPHPRAGAVRAVAHRCAVPAGARAGRDAGAARCRRGRDVFRDRQRQGPPRIGRGRRQMGAGAARVHAPRRGRRMNDASHPSGPLTLAIDIGGTRLKASVLTSGGGMIEQPNRVDTPKPAKPDAVVAALLEVVKPLGAFDRISIGFPGVVHRGRVVTAPNLGTEDWHGYALPDALKERLGKPARMLNDATVQGLGVISGRGLECAITLGHRHGVRAVRSRLSGAASRAEPAPGAQGDDLRPVDRQRRAAKGGAETAGTVGCARRLGSSPR